MTKKAKRYIVKKLPCGCYRDDILKQYVICPVHSVFIRLASDGDTESIAQYYVGDMIDLFYEDYVRYCFEFSPLNLAS